MLCIHWIGGSYPPSHRPGASPPDTTEPWAACRRETGDCRCRRKVYLRPPGPLLSGTEPPLWCPSKWEWDKAHCRPCQWGWHSSSGRRYPRLPPLQREWNPPPAHGGWLHTLLSTRPPGPAVPSRDGDIPPYNWQLPEPAHCRSNQRQPLCRRKFPRQCRLGCSPYYCHAFPSQPQTRMRSMTSSFTFWRPSLP